MSDNGQDLEFNGSWDDGRIEFSKSPRKTVDKAPAQTPSETQSTKASPKSEAALSGGFPDEDIQAPVQEPPSHSPLADQVRKVRSTI